MKKLTDCTLELCFCCEDSPSMEVINLPCCKASVNIHCVFKALQSNNQCVYCQKVLNPQDIIFATKVTTRGKHFPNYYTSTTKGTTRGKHFPIWNFCQHQSSKHSWGGTCTGWRHGSTGGTCSGWREQSVQYFNFCQKQWWWTIVCAYMHQLF